MDPLNPGDQPNNGNESKSVEKPGLPIKSQDGFEKQEFGVTESEMFNDSSKAGQYA
jgi:hypothetical protein